MVLYHLHHICETLFLFYFLIVAINDVCEPDLRKHRCRSENLR